MRPIVSDALVAVGYNPSTRILLVHFRKSWSVYAYYGVPPALFEELLAAQPHPWGRVGRRVRRYPAARVWRAA